MASVTRLSEDDQSKLVDAHLSELPRVSVATFVTTAPVTEQDLSLLSYKIPFVSEDGNCSMPDKLQPEPHHTMDAMSVATLSDGRAALCHVKEAGQEHVTEARRVRSIQALCQAVADATGSQWVGVYERVHLPGHAHDVLAKLQYVGAPSRPFFPLTQQFASHSNNSTVGLTGQAVLIGDTRSMESDTPYYTCDGRVRSELCAPIVQGGVVVGIIDAESFKAHTYTPGATALVLDVCRQLAESDMLRSLL